MAKEEWRWGGQVLISPVMKSVRSLIVLLFFMPAIAQNPGAPPFHGIIYGAALDNDGRPAREIRLVAYKLAGATGGYVPAGSTRTDQGGRFHFESIAAAGTYTVVAEDEAAGYSRGGNWPSGPLGSESVDLSPKSPEAELDLRLPPKAGFLLIHLVNRKPGEAIPHAEMIVTTDDQRPQTIFHWEGYSDRVVSVPSGRTLLLHISLSGFREWSESLGRGRPIRLRPLERMTLQVALDPAD